MTNPKKLLTLLGISIFISISMLAQAQTVTGRVASESGEPVADASVIVKGTSSGTTTDAAGRFSLQISGPATLVVSSINYVASEINASPGSQLEIVLMASSGSLGEVYVVAYGTQKRSELTSAVSTVSAKVLKNQQIVSVGQALQGTASGVLVVNTNGQPGENPTIRIRGVASILATADPLIVVDGIVFPGNLSMIAPNDIESISVLKDATASSLYGSRAANGVVLITTKLGKKAAPPAITVTTLYGISSRAKPDYAYLNTQQHFELGWEGLRNIYSGGPVEEWATEDLVPFWFRYNPYGPDFPNPVGTDGKLVAGAVPLWNDDWTKALTNNSASRQDVNIGISGGTEKSRYYFSAGYLKQEGYVTKSDYERISARLNYTTDLTDWLQVGTRVGLVSSDQNFPDQGSFSFSDVVSFSRTMSSVFPIYARDDDGNLISDAGGNPIYDFGWPDPDRSVNVGRPVLQTANVVGTINLDNWKYRRLLTDLNAFAQVKLLPNLYFKSNFGINRSFTDEHEYQNRDFGVAAAVGGRVYRGQEWVTSWTWNNMVNYKKTFGDHNIEAMASYEAYRYYFENVTGTKTGFPFPGQDQPSNATSIEDFNGYADESTLLSYLGRIRYDFSEKYLAEFTIRRDASSIFAPGRRTGWFPAGGVSWIVSKENFMQKSSLFDFLKLRVSHGALGNNGLADLFPYLIRYATGYSNLENPGVYLTNLMNNDIQWERQITTNIGIDFSTLKSRLTGSIDLFDKSSKSLLFRRPLPPSIGFSSLQTNIGKLQNRGVELNLRYKIVDRRDFSWDVSFNGTYVQNKIRSLLPGQDTVASNGAFRNVVGKSIYEFYMPVWAGVDPETGWGMWYVNERDGNNIPTGKKITTSSYSDALADAEWVGSGLPKFMGGFGTSVQILNFDVSLLFNYAFGGKYYDENYAALMHSLYSGYGAQMHADQWKRWQKVGDMSDVPMMDPSNNDASQLSTRFLFSGDYVRLRNLTIGYTFNPDRSRKILKGARFYLQADNIATWDRLKDGSDPESSIDGYSGANAVPLQTISAGLDFNF